MTSSTFLKECGIATGCDNCIVNEHQNWLLKTDLDKSTALVEELVRDRGVYWRTAERYKQNYRLALFALVLVFVLVVVGWLK